MRDGQNSIPLSDTFGRWYRLAGIHSVLEFPPWINLLLRKIAHALNSGVSIITQAKLTGSQDLSEFILVSLALIMVDPFYR